MIMILIAIGLGILLGLFVAEWWWYNNNDK